MKEYTVGFIFNKDLGKVLLVHKTHPPFLANKHNGIGGKIEEGESVIEGFLREVKEEADLSLDVGCIRHIGFFVASLGKIHIVAAQYNGIEADAKTMTDEQIIWHSLDGLPTSLMDNVSWFIPLCKEELQYNRIDSMAVTLRPGC